MLSDWLAPLVVGEPSDELGSLGHEYDPLGPLTLNSQ